MGGAAPSSVKRFNLDVSEPARIYDGDTITRVKIRISNTTDPNGLLWPNIFIENGGVFLTVGLRLSLIHI